MRFSLVLAGAALFVVPPGLAGQTAMFRGGADHSGVYASAPPSLQSLVWKFRTAGRVISSPLVVGDAVFVAAQMARCTPSIAPPGRSGGSSRLAAR